MPEHEVCCRCQIAYEREIERLKSRAEDLEMSLEVSQRELEYLRRANKSIALARIARTC
jgi:hypothetical protein